MPVQISDSAVHTIAEMARNGARIVDIMKATGLTRNTVAQRIQGVPQRPTAQPDQFVTYQSDGTVCKPRVRVKAGSSAAPELAVSGVGQVVRVVVVADTHDNPSLQQHRFEHIGHFIHDESPDVVVHLGDWADFEFASRFEDWSSIHGRERSPFRDELDSLRRAVERFQTPIAHMSKPPKLITTLGNHDERVWLFENTHPECEGMMWSELEKALGGWEVYPYRQYAFIGGVGFTHAPHNAGGKPYIGKVPENQIANDASFSVVSGHTHKAAYRNVPKLGPQNQITVFNPGCALPYGYIKPYAALSMTGWSWAVGTLEICEGRIIGHSITSMEVLERRYG